MLEQEVQRLRQRLLFQRRLDEFLESAGSRRTSLEAGLHETLPLMLKELEAGVVWLDTLDEGLRPRTFATDADGPVEIDRSTVEKAAAWVALGEPRVAHDSGLLVCRLDVAGEHFGTLAALYASDEAAADTHRAELILVAAEVIDNYLAAIRDSREKQQLLRSIHGVLGHPVVHVGVRDAVRLILDTVRFDLLIVLYHIEDDYLGTLHYLVFRGTELEFSSREHVAEALDKLLREQGLVQAPGGQALIHNAEVEHRRVVGEETELEDETTAESLMASLGYRECLETLLISGMEEGQSVGKLVVGSRRPLSTYERDVFDLFSDVLQKRIVDFSKVGKLLRRTFPTPVVLRLLHDPQPMKMLEPRAADISILFADVAGFTRLSEQVLEDPAKIGAFIDEWSRGATRVLWKHGGVFDKLVGDCIIGLFGPPFYELDPAERALACVRAAAEICAFTNAMLDEADSTQEIKAAGERLGVAVGLNDAPASVGLFGLDRSFTAFAPGMNNAARLQSLAVCDEVLVMEPMKLLIESAGAGVRFGARRQAGVKNVAEPLVFYPLDLGSL